MSLFELNFTRSVTIEYCTSENKYGSRTYTEPITVPAIISYTVKNIKDFRGNTFITAAWIALPPGIGVFYDSRVTIPGEETSFVGSINKIFDEEAGDFLYTELYCGRVAPGEGSL